MSASFPADWLALREPYDHAARDARLAGRLAAWAARRATLDIVDLGAGLVFGWQRWASGDWRVAAATHALANLAALVR